VAEIDGRAALVDHDDDDRGGQAQLADEGLGLATGRAVADGDRLDLVLVAQGAHHQAGLGGFPLGMRDEEHIVVQQLALAVEHDRLAARAVARIQGQHVLAAQGRGQQQFAEVLGEDANGGLVGGLLQLHPHLGFHRGGEQPLVASWTARRTWSAAGLRLAIKRASSRLRAGLPRDRPSCMRNPSLSAAAHGQHAVRRGGGHWLGPLEIVLELGPLGLLALDHPRADRALLEEQLAHRLAALLILAHAFGNDVAGAGQRLLGRGDALFLADEFGGFRFGLGVRLLGQQHVRQRLEPLLPGDGRPERRWGRKGR